MRKLIKKILKEEISDHVSDKQQKVLDYAVKDIIDNIEITPNKVIYEHIDAVLDDPYMDNIVNDIMENWREMDARGWRVGDGEDETSDDMVFYKKSDPSRYMSQWDAREEIAKEVMAELVEAGKFSRLAPEENEFFRAPDGRVAVGWESIYSDYEVHTPNIPLKMSFPLWYEPFRDFYYPHGMDKYDFQSSIEKYVREVYGIRKDEAKLLFERIKKGIRDKISSEGINVNYNNPWGYVLSQGDKVIEEGVIDDFVSFTKDELSLDDDFGVELEDDSDELETLASYDIEDNKVKVLSKNRALPDIIRSIAHELVHHKQNQEGELTGDEDEGADGSPQENEANARAGKIVRRFGKRYPEIYDL